MVVNPLGNPDDNTLLDTAITWHLKRLRHTFPAKIVEFDLVTQTATIQSTVKFVARNVATGEIVDEQVITCPGIPIAFYGTGEWSITGPININDEGWCHVSDICLSEWKATTTTPATPKNTRIWNQNDAIWEPKHCRPSKPLSTSGLRPAVDLDNERVVIKVGDAQTLHLGSLDTSSLVALASLVLDRLNQIKTAYDLHTHPAPIIGSTNAPAVPMGAFSSVGANKVLGE